MEPTFIALREYLADGLERLLNRGDDIREAYLDCNASLNSGV